MKQFIDRKRKIKYKSIFTNLTSTMFIINKNHITKKTSLK